jgi:hypothetical protein
MPGGLNMRKEGRKKQHDREEVTGAWTVQHRDKSVDGNDS